MENIKQQLCDARETLRAKTRGIIMQYDQQTESFRADTAFREVGKNVVMVLCSLDSPNITVVNVRYGKGGEIEPHSHDRYEHAYVLDGSINDLKTNQSYGKGEVYVIPPNQIHHIVSDYALLVVTWTPAYEEHKVELQE